jgi:hypothetical protein
MARSCGHFATKSRRYSTTRAALKTIRREWPRSHHAEHHTTEHTDEETTLVIGGLSFAGIGYRSAGDRWLALTAAARARQQRQIAREECMSA